MDFEVEFLNICNDNLISKKKIFPKNKESHYHAGNAIYAHFKVLNYYLYL